MLFFFSPVLSFSLAVKFIGAVTMTNAYCHTFRVEDLKNKPPVRKFSSEYLIHCKRSKRLCCVEEIGWIKMGRREILWEGKDERKLTSGSGFWPRESMAVSLCFSLIYTRLRPQEKLTKIASFFFLLLKVCTFFIISKLVSFNLKKKCFIFRCW